MATAVGAILLTSVALYAVLGGADFGGGLWDLLAGGDRRGRAPRQLIDDSITPVWEGNHVWLVFALVIFWTAFPYAFAAVMTVVALPLWLALGGVVLRGAGFAFRKEISRTGLRRMSGAIFAFSSFLTPFFMGTVVGAIATGSIPATGGHASLAAWTSPTSIIAGFLFVAACGYLAAVYLTKEAARRNDQRLEAYFSYRAIAAALVAGALSLAALAALHSADPLIYTRLTGRALPLVVLSGVCGLAVVIMLALRTPWAIREIAALGVVATIWGWGIDQYPTILPGTNLTLYDAGAPYGSLTSIVVIAVVAGLLVVPSFLLLFTLSSRSMLHHEDMAVTAGAGPSDGSGRTHPPAEPAGRPSAGATITALAVIAAGVVLRRRRHTQAQSGDGSSTRRSAPPR